MRTPLLKTRYFQLNYIQANRKKQARSARESCVVAISRDTTLPSSCLSGVAFSEDGNLIQDLIFDAVISNYVRDLSFAFIFTHPWEKTCRGVGRAEAGGRFRASEESDAFGRFYKSKSSTAS